LGSTTQLQLIGVNPTNIEAVHPFVISEGRFLQADDTGKAIIPAGLAELAPQLGVGTTFPLITAGGLKFYTVVGLLAEQGDLSAPQIYVTLDDAQAAFNQPGLINTVEVSIRAGADAATVAAVIQQALGDSYVLNNANDASSTLAAMQVGFAMFDMLGALALFLGAFLIFNTFRTIVVERRHDLAMLRVVGATRRQITLMIVIESLIQGVLGTAIGLLIGFLIAQGGVSFMGRFWAMYLNRGALSLQMNVSAILGAVALGLATSLFAGFIPARAAGKVSPLDALRPVTAASIYRAARWSVVVGVGIMALAVLLLLSGSKGAVGGALLFLMGMVVAAPGLVLPMARLFSP
ncbi:MAG: FtsX-like permease family protein, partial [Acidobacteriales bacterium]|nr:FtsX-like permease family protein [Terriglobales bacterium]